MALMLPTSVATITRGGMAFSSSRSTWRGCRYLPPVAVFSPLASSIASRLNGSRSWVHSSSSFSHAAFSASIVRARPARLASPARGPPRPGPGRSRAPGLVGVAGQRRAVQAPEQFPGAGLGIAVDAHGDLLDQPQVGVVGLDLDDLRVLGPVVDAVLRQRAERAHARAEREH